MSKESLLMNVKNLLTSNTVHGWCTFDKAKMLVDLIVDTKPTLCVEIGVFGGSSLLPQAMALAYNGKGVIYGIDPWDNGAALEGMKNKDSEKWWDSINLDEIHKSCMDHIKKLVLESYCHLIKDKAENVVGKFDDSSIDLLHIDGNHSEELAYKDATLYLPKVKVGGYVAFDDIWWTEEQKVTTRKALLYLMDHCTRVSMLGDCMLLQRVK